LLINGVSAGVGGVLVFLPQILILFLFIAILEDCGYMARAAFLLDRWMGKMGIGGKAFIPLLSSFACAVPGIMATRTIEDRRDRFVTILIAPLMSCSARLPVYVLLIGLFVPANPLLGGLLSLQAATLIAMYAVGVVVAVPIALLLKRTVFKGPAQSFLLELPTFKWPSAATVLHRMYEQGREFAVSAGTIIFAVAILVWALGYYPHPASIAADHDARRAAAQSEFDQSTAGAGASSDEVERSRQRLDGALTDLDRSEAGTYLRQSLLGRMGHWIEPIVEPLGWDWRIGTAVIASFPAREVVIATMGTIYNLGEDQDETSAGLRRRLHEAKRPDGQPMFNLAVALSIMVFFALCCQCAATLATIRRETNSWRWPIVTFAYMTALAYVGALATYQIAIRFT
jgi:ferrous iron transport protein B